MTRQPRPLFARFARFLFVSMTACCSGFAVFGFPPPVPSVGPDMLIQAGTPGLQLSQPALAVTAYSTTHSTEVLIGWSTWDYSFSNALLFRGLGVSTSLNNGVSFTAQPFAFSGCYDEFGTHAMVAVSAASGDLWVGGTGTLGINLARKPYGIASLDPVVLAECNATTSFDPFMTIGPPFDISAPETM